MVADSSFLPWNLQAEAVAVEVKDWCICNDFSVPNRFHFDDLSMED